MGNKPIDSNDDETINELALAAIKHTSEKHDVALDLHSAVYIFHLVQMLAKHVTAAGAHETHVGKFYLMFFNRVDSFFPHKLYKWLFFFITFFFGAIKCHFVKTFYRANGTHSMGVIFKAPKPIH